MKRLSSLTIAIIVLAAAIGLGIEGCAEKHAVTSNVQPAQQQQAEQMQRVEPAAQPPASQPQGRIASLQTSIPFPNNVGVTPPSASAQPAPSVTSNSLSNSRFGGGGGFGGGAGGGGGRRGGGGGGGGGGLPLAQGSNREMRARGNVIGNGQRVYIPPFNEELWIIAVRRPGVRVVPVDDLRPGTGSLLARLPSRPEQIPVPLKHTDVKAWISGYIATVDVQQQYQNPYGEKIEAQYVFPLPDNAAVNDFLMTIGDRKIRGIIRERAEAEQIYREARAQGYVASLLTEERPNIFTQNVANIEPGKEIDVDIKYFHTLDYVDGWYEWTFPMVVGPRFNPSSSGDGVGAVGLNARGTSGQPTEIQYLRPNQRSGHDISLSVQLDPGMKVEQIESVNHRTITQTHGDAVGVTDVRLDPSDSIPNKDFVLRYKVAGGTVKSAMMVQRDPKGNGGYFTLMLVPPESMKDIPRHSLEMVFTLDVSGSMDGRPIEQARAAVTYALNHMQPTDTFQVIRFANSTEAMTDRAVPATPENVRLAMQYIAQMRAGGGTMMLDGIKQSLNFSRDENHLRFVAFLTDGYIGNEAEILREIHNSLRDSRIFSFGVGTSPNRYLLDEMAKMGAGAAAYLSADENPDDVMAAYFERISHPTMTDIAVDFGGMQASEVYPAKVPDLFVGRPIILTGKFTGHGQTTIHVKARIAGEVRDLAIPVQLDATENQHPDLASVWGRMKIASLADQSTWDDKGDWANSIKNVALEQNLMSAYTSFVAVDTTERTAGDHGTTVTVPVPVPQGVRYDTTVQER